MSTLFLAVVVLAGALAPASAQQPAARRRRTSAPAGTRPADKAAFDQLYVLVFLQAGKSYLREDQMPEPSDLDPYIAALKNNDLVTARQKRARLEEVIAAAECVQQGPGGIPHDVYRLLVEQVAGDLEVGAIVEQEFVPNARAGRSLDAAELALTRECGVESRAAVRDRRAAYQKCLGRKRSEAVYLARARLDARTTNAPPAAGCSASLQELEVRRSRLPEGSDEIMRNRLAETRQRLLAGMLNPTDPGSGSVYGNAARNQSPLRATPQSAASLFRNSGRPSPMTSADLKLDEPPLNVADIQTGARLATIARNGQVGFTGMCYAYTKDWLQRAGIVSRSSIDRQSTGSNPLNASAFLFSQFVDRHPALLNRKLRRVPNPAWPLPIGAVVVWAPTSCGYSQDHGHIEIVTRIQPAQACSDGCGNFQWACLEELAPRAEAGRAQSPQAQQAVADAQAAYNRRRSSANLAALRRAKRALAAVEPVTVYVVEREPANVAAR